MRRLLLFFKKIFETGLRGIDKSKFDVAGDFYFFKKTAIKKTC